MASDETDSVREAVGLFDRSSTLQEAIDELLSSGFDRAELSLLASEKAVDEKLGRHYRKASSKTTPRSRARPTPRRNRSATPRAA